LGGRESGHPSLVDAGNYEPTSNERGRQSAERVIPPTPCSIRALGGRNGATKLRSPRESPPPPHRVLPLVLPAATDWPVVRRGPINRGSLRGFPRGTSRAMGPQPRYEPEHPSTGRCACGARRAGQTWLGNGDPSLLGRDVGTACHQLWFWPPAVRSLYQRAMVLVAGRCSVSARCSASPVPAGGAYARGWAEEGPDWPALTDLGVFCAAAEKSILADGDPWYCRRSHALAAPPFRKPVRTSVTASHPSCVRVMSRRPPVLF